MWCKNVKKKKEYELDESPAQSWQHCSAVFFCYGSITIIELVETKAEHITF